MCCKWLSCQCRSHASMARVNTVRCGLFDESVIFTGLESCISFYSFIRESFTVFLSFAYSPTLSRWQSASPPLHQATRRRHFASYYYPRAQTKCVPFILHSESDLETSMADGGQDFAQRTDRGEGHSKASTNSLKTNQKLYGTQVSPVSLLRSRMKEG